RPRVRHISPETRHVVICDECRREPMNVRFSCRKMPFSTGLWLLLLESLLEMEMKVAGQSLEFGFGPRKSYGF
ncbi:hypothetical protein M9458_058107, partial [Cirrhinus mrigala]